MSGKTNEEVIFGGICIIEREVAIALYVNFYQEYWSRNTSTSYTCIPVAIPLQVLVLCDYELQVTFYTFDNPGRRCADTNCQARYCESDFNDCCEYYFSLCLRPVGTPVSYLRNQNQGNCSTLVTSAQENAGSINFTSTFFNFSNPIAFSGPSWVSFVDNN